jgi:hypothetical protein
MARLNHLGVFLEQPYKQSNEGGNQDGDANDCCPKGSFAGVCFNQLKKL